VPSTLAAPRPATAPEPGPLSVPPSPTTGLPFPSAPPGPPPPVASAAGPSPPTALAENPLASLPPAPGVVLPEPGSFKAIQLYDTYLVVETEQGMLVIDQHALHERILFEQLKRRVRSGPLETQRLLIPEPVDLSAEQAARVLEQRAALAELGLGVEDFGGG